MLTLMRYQDTPLLLILYKTPVQQILLVIRVHVLSEHRKYTATRRTAQALLLLNHAFNPKASAMISDIVHSRAFPASASFFSFARFRFMASCHTGISNWTPLRVSEPVIVPPGNP